MTVAPARRGRPLKGAPLFVTPPGSPYPTPEAEYIESPDGINHKDLAAKWGVTWQWVKHRSDKGRWVEKRKAHLESLAEARTRGAAQAERERALKMGRMREEAPSRHAKLSQALQARIAAKLQNAGITTVEIQRLASALRNAVEVERLSLGLTCRVEVTDGTGVDGEGADASVARVLARVASLAARRVDYGVEGEAGGQPS